MKKLKNETALFKAALLAAIEYAQGRGAVEFEPTDSASEKLFYVYRLLVHDKLIQPLPESQVSEAALRHKLAIWYARQLPADHPLLRSAVVLILAALITVGPSRAAAGGDLAAAGRPEAAAVLEWVNPYIGTGSGGAGGSDYGGTMPF